MIRIAVIGMGQIARSQHIPVIDSHSDFSLAAVVDPVAASPRDGVPLFKSADALFDSATAFDAVAICTPPSIRFDVAERALNKGLHVLVEKPPTMTVTETHYLANMAQQQEVSFFTAWHSCFSAAMPQASELIAQHGLRAVKIIWLEDNEKWHPNSAWLWESTGFGVLDPGINALSMLLKLVPQGVFLRKALLDIRNGQQSPVRADIELGIFGSDAIVSGFFDCDYKGPDETWTIECILGDGSILELSKGGAALSLDVNVLIDPSKTDDGALGHEYPALYNQFSKLIKERRIESTTSPLQLVTDILAYGERRPA